MRGNNIVKKLLKLSALMVAAFGIVAGFAVTPSYAASNTNVTQSITAGSLTTDIRDASRVAVAGPTFALGAVGFSFSCQTSTGTIGSTAQRLYVDNPGAANNGWTLTLAATAGATDTWKNAGTTQSFDFNDPTTSGCDDGVDADSRPGQLTVNPSVGTLTADCTSCTTANITKGASSAYSQGVLDSVTILNAAAASDDAGRWYLTGVGVSQTIPAEQAVDSYTVNLTATVTAS